MELEQYRQELHELRIDFQEAKLLGRNSIPCYDKFYELKYIMLREERKRLKEIKETREILFKMNSLEHVKALDKFILKFSGNIEKEASDLRKLCQMILIAKGIDSP